MKLWSAYAPILHSGPNEITFAVDNVKPGDDRFPTFPIEARVEGLTKRALCAASHAPRFPVVADNGHHALLSAVHLAFSRHLPLAITPDTIWLTIAQGFAQHIANHAEELRPQLVRHEGKTRLNATVFSLEREDWEHAAEQWAEQIETHIPPDLHNTLLCDFSSTTPTIRVASQIVMMEAFRPYFDYLMVCICGIPQITLHGTVEDWRVIRSRVERLAQFQLDWWTDRLLPLCDAFIATAEGRPARKFWQQIYKPENAYGGEQITGWVADLFPYILDVAASPKRRNPLLAKPRQEITTQDGLRAERFPTGLSTAPVTLEIQELMNKKLALQFLGGFFGVTQNPQTGCLQPEIGWGVQEQDAFTALLEALAQDHSLAPHANPLLFDKMEFGIEGMSGEMFRMLDHFDGGVLFADTTHPWKLRSCRDYTLHRIVGGRECTCFLDLEDGRKIGYVSVGMWGVSETGVRTWKDEFWIVTGRLKPGFDVLDTHPAEVFPPESITVIAKSLAQFFERVVAADGHYYFDSPNFIPDASSVMYEWG